MPFPTVTIAGQTKTFEQVLNGLIHYAGPLLVSGDAMPYEGWGLSDYLSALDSMVSESSNKLWAAAINEEGDSKADKLKIRLDAMELDLSRMASQISSLQVKP